MPMAIGDGWEQVASPRLCGTFLAASHADPSTKFSRLFRLGKTQDSLAVPVTSIRSLTVAGGRLLFVSPHEGLFSYEPGAKDPNLIFAARKGNALEFMWASPQADEALVQQTHTDSDAKRTSVLLRIDLSNGRSELVKTFEEYPSFIEVSWPRLGFFVSYHATDRVSKIDLIDLKSGRSKSVHQSDGLHGISLSNRGNLVHWPLHDCGPIEALKEDGSSVRLTEFGWFPAFSRNGDMAFLMGDHTLWIRTRGGRLLRTASRGWVNAAEMVFPSWCPCGRHVAALLGGGHPVKWLARDLVFADLERKEVAVFEQAIADPTLNIGGQAWLMP